MKKYKRVYLEITNRCNLSCDFCIKNDRCLRNLSFDELKIILEKLKDVTDYLYFHILGEPLMHSNINSFINYASNNFFVNITTNGYLIEKIKYNKNIRQVNISLHSFNDRYKVSLDKYLDNVFDAVDNFVSNKTYVSLRLWVDCKYNDIIKRKIEDRFDCKIDLSSGSYKISKFLFVSFSDMFIWPDLDNDFYSEVGKCYGLIDHFGILVDGTIVPCCLDSKGVICLGNIFSDDLLEVLDSKRSVAMREGFKKNIKCENLCRHCLFIKE